MAFVYILYSPSINKFYVGSCKDLLDRINDHLTKIFPDAYTATVDDWTIYFVFENLTYSQARKIELHIKRMKSKKFIENLKKYPELSDKLIVIYK